MTYNQSKFHSLCDLLLFKENSIFCTIFTQSKLINHSKDKTYHNKSNCTEFVIYICHFDLFVLIFLPLNYYKLFACALQPFSCNYSLFALKKFLQFWHVSVKFATLELSTLLNSDENLMQTKTFFLVKIQFKSTSNFKTFAEIHLIYLHRNKDQFKFRDYLSYSLSEAYLKCE